MWYSGVFMYRCVFSNRLFCIKGDSGFNGNKLKYRQALKSVEMMFKGRDKVYVPIAAWEAILVELDKRGARIKALEADISKLKRERRL